MDKSEKKVYVRVSGARSDGQRRQMEQIVRDGICPFCREHLEKYHEGKIVEETEHWVLTQNDHPYAGTTTHLLFIAKEHVTRPERLSNEAMIDLFRLFGKATADLKGATLFMRTGEMSYTGATVDHLHAHIISGMSADEGGEAVKAKVAFGAPLTLLKK